MVNFDQVFLRYAPIPEPVQSELLSRHDELAGNPSLSESTIRRAFAKKLPSSDTATRLLQRAVSSETAEVVLAKEKRPTVLEALAGKSWYNLTVAQRRTLASRARGHLADQLLDLGDGLDDKSRKDLSTRASAAGRLGYMLSAPGVSDADVSQWLADAPQWLAKKPTSSVRLRLEAVLHQRPGVMAAAAAHLPERLLSVAAGALTCTDVDVQKAIAERVMSGQLTYVAMALVANPVCRTEIREEITTWATGRSDCGELRSLLARDRVTVETLGPDTDPEALDQVVRRALPNQYRPSGRPVQLWYLTRCQLPEPYAEKVADAYESCSMSELDDKPTDPVDPSTLRGYPGLAFGRYWYDRDNDAFANVLPEDETNWRDVPVGHLTHMSLTYEARGASQLWWFTQSLGEVASRFDAVVQLTGKPYLGTLGELSNIARAIQ